MIQVCSAFGIVPMSCRKRRNKWLCLEIHFPGDEICQVWEIWINPTEMFMDPNCKGIRQITFLNICMTWQTSNPSFSRIRSFGIFSSQTIFIPAFSGEINVLFKPSLSGYYFEKGRTNLTIFVKVQKPARGLFIGDLAQVAFVAD